MDKSGRAWLSNFSSMVKGIDISFQEANWPVVVEKGRVRGDPVGFAIMEATAGPAARIATELRTVPRIARVTSSSTGIASSTFPTKDRFMPSV